ncbi:hypothetical protein Trydic_g21639 [Trypoxylus dichotomus]
MKVLLLTLLVIGGVFADVNRNPNLRVGENNTMAFFDCLREIGYTGNEEAGVPVMDPLWVEEAYSDLAVYGGAAGLWGKARVLNAFIVGILGFEYDTVSGTIGILPPRFQFDVTLRFPRLQVSIDHYDVNIFHERTNTNLHGVGRLAFDARDLYVRLKLSLFFLSMGIQGISIVPTLYGMNSFAITGLFNDEEYSQQVSRDFLLNPYDAMANISGSIDAVLSPLLTEVLLDTVVGNDNSLIWQCAFPSTR